VPVGRLAGRERAPAHRGSPVDLGRGELDLAEDDVDHAVEELLLVRDVVVERHRAGAELVRKPANRQRLEPLALRERNRGLEHALPAQRRT